MNGSTTRSSRSAFRTDSITLSATSSTAGSPDSAAKISSAICSPTRASDFGAAIPHVESNVGGTFHEEYQLHGPGVQALAGMNIGLNRHWGLMFEYKFTYANLGSLDIPGGSIEVTPLTHHLVTGLTFSF